MTILGTDDGIDLAVRTWSASGDARATVILVHGLAATKDNPELVRVAEALRDRALDMRVRSPLAVVHGEKDRFVPPREAAGLYANGAGPRRLDLVPRMGHAFHPAAVPVICDAVDWTLAKSAAVAVPTA